MIRRVAIALLSLSSCAYHVRDQRIPDYALEAREADFAEVPGTAVLHYYGSGGWGVLWRGTYLLAAPYFSNHTIAALQLTRLEPNAEAVRAGFRNTPVGRTSVVLVGHGHIDHAGDVPGFFGEGLITGAPALVADVSTVNLLAPIAKQFGCVAALDYFGSTDPSRCVPSNVRITPLHSAHAPHVRVGGVDFAAFAGFESNPRAALPDRGEDFKLGNTWAFLIDLLDERGDVALRIHYGDAAASSPHGFAPLALRDARPVDVQITCVPGYDLVEGYPEESLAHHRTQYVLAAHWEDFFIPRTWSLRPVEVVLSEAKLGDFVDRVERTIGTTAPKLGPVNDADRCAGDRCGPHGARWSVPVPGETYRFATGPQVTADR